MFTNLANELGHHLVASLLKVPRVAGTSFWGVEIQEFLDVPCIYSLYVHLIDLIN